MIVAPEGFLSPQQPARLLFQESHVVVGWSENSIMARRLTEADFFAAGHVVVALGQRRLSFAETEMARLGLHRRIELAAPSFLAVPFLLPGTALLAMMHERLARVVLGALPLRLAPLPFAFPPMREMLQYHRTRAQDAGLQWLIGQIFEAAATC